MKRREILIYWFSGGVCFFLVLVYVVLFMNLIIYNKKFSIDFVKMRFWEVMMYIILFLIRIV